MRLLRGVHEGPGSHGILRLAASMSGVHAVLRAAPGEGYFPALYAARERNWPSGPGDVEPHAGGTGSVVRPGNLARDLAGVVRRHPGTEAVVLARSESALLSGETLPEVPTTEVGASGRAPQVVTCSWESPGMGETEAAELALEDLVRAHAVGGKGRTGYPSVNLFGPPVFGPGAEAEYDEAERLLAQIGVEVNARVPLGTTVEDLRRLPRAWANLLLYREVGESATLYLQDEHGTGRVTTPPIGAAGTGAALRAVGELCGLDPGAVQRTIWAEIARTATLPWYARLEPPEIFRGRRAAVFGDFTYPLGLGYALSREVGLEVAVCGTYLTHLERDFLFHANTFTEGAFVDDDPEQVATRIEAANPDLIVGTELEAPLAETLGIPFLPLCYPAARRPFVERPLVGYAGSSALADLLDGALRR